MTKKNVLYGNGVNIEFSGNDDYKNFAILERMSKNMKESGRYLDVFKNTIDAPDMYDFLDGLNKWFRKYAIRGFKGMQLTENQDEAKALLEMASRYSKGDPKVLEVGLEDYLLALKLFNASFDEGAFNYELLYQGITKIMLDAIYNDGKIEEIYIRMDAYKDELSKYENIFTVNYDSNIDKLTDNHVYHLHGCFNTLHHEFRPETFKAWCIMNAGNELPEYIPEKKYLYCDAVFGFSGEDKLNRIKEYNYVYSNKNFESLRNKHKEFLCPAYPLEKFGNIEGELDIIGLGPHNDSHIFDMINNNDKITKVTYYSACAGDSDKIKCVITRKPLQVKDVFKYWAQFVE